MKITHAVLIGLGHHGRNRLFPALLTINQIQSIFIFDAKPEAFADLDVGEYDKPVHYSTESRELGEAITPESLVVIGTTAKDHLALFRNVIQHGATFVYIEKPIAQSIADCCEIVELAEKNNVRVAVGFFNDFYPFVRQVADIQKEYNLGKLLKVSSQGGASCLSTTGIHIADLAGLLFDCDPLEVYGNIISRTKNPRGDEYFTFGGLIHAVYEDDRELLLSFTNDSLVTYDICLHYEYGLIKTAYDEEFVEIHAFSEDHSTRPKYRYLKPDIVKRNKVSENFEDIFRGFFSKIFCNLLAGKRYCDLTRAMKSMQVILGAFISDSKNAVVTLPICDKDDGFHDKYPIT